MHIHPPIFHFSLSYILVLILTENQTKKFTTEIQLMPCLSPKKPVLLSLNWEATVQFIGVYLSSLVLVNMVTGQTWYSGEQWSGRRHVDTNHTRYWCGSIRKSCSECVELGYLIEPCQYHVSVLYSPSPYRSLSSHAIQKQVIFNIFCSCYYYVSVVFVGG